MKGTLYGIGVGPGDPRLMTYLAVDTIKRCPVIAVPADGKGKAVALQDLQVVLWRILMQRNASTSPLP